MSNIIPTELIIQLITNILKPICDTTNDNVNSMMTSSHQKQADIKKFAQMLIGVLLSKYDDVGDLYIQRDVANLKVNLARLKSVLVLIDSLLQDNSM